MKTTDFYYDLPEDLIAQTPIEDRSASRLLVLNKETGDISHRRFSDLLDILGENDVLVLNDSKVIPARIYGTRTDTGAVVEFLLLKRVSDYAWETLAGPGKKAKIGTVFDFSGLMTGEITEIIDEGIRIIKFSESTNIYAVLDEIGKMPLPPYITKSLSDQARYQTVYAKNLGSAAAPTAGLHFTKEMLARLEEKGVSIVYLTLHVGLGTFRPVKVENVTEHIMHKESYHISESAATAINSAKQKGKRIISVGTTSCRTLESAADETGMIAAGSGETGIFIYPGYKFKVIDALITNFHLPESTLLMLVSAFSSKEKIMAAYAEAIKEKYRFFSFGDAMFIE